MLLEVQKLQFIDCYSEGIFHRREHAILGVSPSNSYYSEEKITASLAFLSQHFARITVFAGQGISCYNFLSFGYTQNQAIKKTRAQDRLISNRIQRAIASLPEACIDVLSENDLLHNAIYQEKYLQYKQLFEEDLGLQSIIYQMISQIKICNRPMQNPAHGVNYFLAELPLLLDTPSVLGVPSSCFVYSDVMAVADFIYRQQQLNAPNQGFVALSF